MSENNVLKISTLEDIAEYSKGKIVELPPFGEGMPFVARLRRPSMMVLAKSGKIPNSLLNQANKLFFGSDGKTKVDQDALSQTLEVMDVICEASFVEPSFAELKSAGVELTDEQYMFVFNYAQKGVNALSSFRNE